MLIVIKIVYEKWEIPFVTWNYFFSNVNDYFISTNRTKKDFSETLNKDNLVVSLLELMISIKGDNYTLDVYKYVEQFPQRNISFID